MNSQNLIMHTVTVKCDGNCRTLAAQMKNLADSTINEEAVKSSLVFIATRIKEAAERGSYEATVRLHTHLDINSEAVRNGKKTYQFQDGRVYTTDAEYNYIIGALQEEGFQLSWGRHGFETPFFRGDMYAELVIRW